MKGFWSFQQHEHESFLDAWERFQDLRRTCSDPLIQGGRELHVFFKGLTKQSKSIMNTSAGGSIKGKTLK